MSTQVVQNGSGPATASEPQTDVTVTNDSNEHNQTRIVGDQVTYDEHDTSDRNVHGTWSAEADEHVRSLITKAMQEREQREDVRANHRNLNRGLTLVGALVIGLILTYLLNYVPHLPHWMYVLAPFTFVITILLDSAFVFYSLYKHY